MRNEIPSNLSARSSKMAPSCSIFAFEIFRFLPVVASKTSRNRAKLVVLSPCRCGVLRKITPAIALTIDPYRGNCLLATHKACFTTMPPKLWQTIKIGFLVVYRSYISRHAGNSKGTNLDHITCQI